MAVFSLACTRGHTLLRCLCVSLCSNAERESREGFPRVTCYSAGVAGWRTSAAHPASLSCRGTGRGGAARRHQGRGGCHTADFWCRCRYRGWMGGLRPSSPSRGQALQADVPPPPAVGPTAAALRHRGPAGVRLGLLSGWGWWASWRPGATPATSQEPGFQDCN